MATTTRKKTSALKHAGYVLLGVATIVLGGYAKYWADRGLAKLKS